MPTKVRSHPLGHMAHPPSTRVPPGAFRRGRRHTSGKAHARRLGACGLLLTSTGRGCQHSPQWLEWGQHVANTAGAMIQTSRLVPVTESGAPG